jgi:hypothetical protein
MKWLRVWHPVLIGQIPILSAYMANRHQIGLYDLLIPAALTLVLTCMLWALLAWTLKDIAKAALAVSASLFCFLNFNLFDDYSAALSAGTSAAFAIFTLVAVLLACVALLALGMFLVFRRPNAVRTTTVWLNAFSILVTVIIVGPLASDTGRVAIYQTAKRAKPTFLSRPGEIGGPEAGVALETGPKPARLPDIYYIILDAYGRSDVLRDIYDYDNREFLNHLTKKGFYVAGRSTSNYCMTFLSLTSSLNCRYLDQKTGSDWSSFDIAIRNSSVLKTLQQFGYHFVCYASDFPPTDMRNADVYLSPALATTSRENEFYTLLLDKTPLRLRGKSWGYEDFPEDAQDLYTEQRDRTLFVFDTLGKIARDHSPKLVLAHIVCPHPPFVFGENGEDTSPRNRRYLLTDGSYYFTYYGQAADYVQGYRRQISYITKRAEQTIDEILKNSAEPPIMILQSDHGPGSRWVCDSADPDKTDLKERMSILNAYYLPGSGAKGLYEDITPVNSFRLILSNYFGAKAELLPDKSYFCSSKDPFQYVDVSARVRTGAR